MGRSAFVIVVFALGGLLLSTIADIDSLIARFHPTELLGIIVGATLVSALAALSLAAFIAVCVSIAAKVFGGAYSELFERVCLFGAWLWLLIILRSTAAEWSGYALDSVSLSSTIIFLVALLAAWLRYGSKSAQMAFKPVIASLLLCAAVYPLSPHFAIPWFNARAEPATASAISSRRHVVLLTIDALSARHLSLYGYASATSPNLDAFAAGGRVFDRFYANANWTTPGAASIIKGARPWTTRDGMPVSFGQPALSQHNLLALAQAAGMTVSTFISNSNASPARLAVSENVDHQDCSCTNDHWSLITGCFEYLGVPAPVVYLTVFRYLPYRITALLAVLRSESKNATKEPRLALESAEAWLGSHRQESTFTWIHLHPPHDPYLAPDEFNGFAPDCPPRRDVKQAEAIYYSFDREAEPRVAQLSACYDESVRYVDERTGEFLNWLHSDEEYRDALVVITADHGESFHDGYGGHGGPRSPEEVIHIPLIIRGPGVEPGREHGLWQQVDLLPTLAAWMGVPDDSPMHEGHRLPLSGKVDSSMGYDVYSMSLEQVPRDGPLTSGAITLIRDRYKYVHYFGKLNYPNMTYLPDEFYYLGADPLGDHDLHGTRPDIETPMLEVIRKQIALHAQ